MDVENFVRSLKLVLGSCDEVQLEPGRIYGVRRLPYDPFWKP